MPRKPRITTNGFFHIINRGVEKRKVFLDDADFIKFLSLVDEYKPLYQYSVQAYCLMDNHYHLLLETTKPNLSTIMRQINYKYTIYFNKKYKRVGPLWQSRFKSWYVYNQRYLDILIKYIEQNPIKASIIKEIGQYAWASKVSQENFMSDKELQDFDTFHNAKFKVDDNMVAQLKNKPLEQYFNNKNIGDRNKSILQAVCDGYKQSEIAQCLNLSDVAISKIIKTERLKESLFDKIKDKGLFWSYGKDISFIKTPTNTLIEQLLKYGDFDDIVQLFKLFGKKQITLVWKNKLRPDHRFIKTNLMLARVFLDMDIESNYFKDVKNERLEKLRLLAS